MDVQMKTSAARRRLADLIAREAFAPFAERIDSVRFRMPKYAARSGTRRASLEVRLETGARLACSAEGRGTADTLEAAAHAMRRKILAELGLPLIDREGGKGGDPRAERRAR